MDWKSEWKKLSAIVAVFAVCFWLPVGTARFNNAVLEAFHLVRWYAREHVLLCLVPAFFIAGAIGVFVSQASVMKYLGAKANKVLAYGVASVSGTILAVCSCTVLPLFAGIYRMGAGLGPACAFLYSGPAINVLAIVLTARILGLELGIARALGAILFSVVIGLLMHLIFRREEADKAAAQAAMPEPDPHRPVWKTCLILAAMVAVLVFANWARSGDMRAVFLCCPGGLSTFQVEGRIVERSESGVRFLDTSGMVHEIESSRVVALDEATPEAIVNRIHSLRWVFTGAALIAGLVMVFAWIKRDERSAWVASAWDFAGKILPMLLLGVLIAGFLLGRPAHEGLLPGRWVEMLVGDRPDMFFATVGLSPTSGAGQVITALWPLCTNAFAAVVGAFMYFATLTEVPILQGLIGAGMGKGPALALLLAGPALSLPNMLVIRSIMGTKKTLVFVLLVVVMAAITGMGYGVLSSELGF